MKPSDDLVIPAIIMHANGGRIDPNGVITLNTTVDVHMVMGHDERTVRVSRVEMFTPDGVRLTDLQNTVNISTRWVTEVSSRTYIEQENHDVLA